MDVCPHSSHCVDRCLCSNHHTYLFHGYTHSSPLVQVSQNLLLTNVIIFVKIKIYLYAKTKRYLFSKQMCFISPLNASAEVTYNYLLPTGSEAREVSWVGNIPVAILLSCQNMEYVALQLHKHIV